jgi:hypothetical protein
VLTAGLVLGGAASAGPALGDVLRLQPQDDDLGRPQATTLLRPDGTSRALDRVPGGSHPAGVKALTVSPDRRWVAQTVGTRLVLLPTDGGTAQTLWDPALRPGPAVPPWVGVGSTSAWWNATGTALTTGPLRTASGTTAVRRCTVAPVACRTTALPGALPVGALPDGRLLLANDHRALAASIDEAYTTWQNRSAAWVRRMRALLRRPRTTALRIEARPGAPGHVLWQRRRPASDGIVRFQALVPTGAASGALLQWVRTRLVLRTRRDEGHLQARVAAVDGGSGAWHVGSDGRLRALGASTLWRGTPVVALPDGGWLGYVNRTVRGQRVSRPARISPRGTAVELRVAGRPITPRDLHDALGRPAAERLPLPDPDRGTAEDAEVRVVGFEESTASTVVVYEERHALAVARIPLDGGRPSLVELQPGLATGYVVW